VERLMDLPKVYRTTIRLDQTSPSYDSDAAVTPVVIARPPPPEAVSEAVAALARTNAQVPPAVSALKVGGRAAYELARKGRPPALAARPVTIYWIVVHRYAWPEVEMEVACGRGTYVRAIARDLGERLATGGCVARLERTAVGPFTGDGAWTLDRLGAPGAAARATTPLAELAGILAAPATRLPPPKPPG
jgi:tRNA pseudouridine55 synthase